jgi:hypothetical protein
LQWEKLFGEFMKSFRMAAERDMRSDHHGNVFLPIIVRDTSNPLPQRGQFEFLWCVPLGDFFLAGDSLMASIVRGNLGMLDATMKEGLVLNSGWLNDGVWPWLGGIHGIAQSVVGNDRRAIDLLYAFANHASPLGTWVEEQQTRDAGTTTTGDVSDAEASAVFVLLVRDLIARERLGNLEMLTGIPSEWLRPGGRIELNNGFSLFGPLTLKCLISSDGRAAELFVSAIDGRGSSGKPIVYCRALKEAGYVLDDGSPLPDSLAGSWGKEIHVHLRKKH